MYCHHHLTQVWRNWSLAKWEIISKLAEHFFDFGKIGDYVPPNFSVGLGKLEVVDVGNYPRSYEVAKLLLKQSLGAKLEIISKLAKLLF